MLTTLVVNENYDIQANPLTSCYGATVGFGEEILETPGDYTFNYNTAEGCDSTVHVTLSWFEEIVVTGDIVDDWGPGTGTINIDVSGAVDPVQIFWSTGDTNVTTVTDIDAGTTVLVEILDGNNCTQSVEFEVGLSNLTELNEQGIDVYPNPFSNILTLDISNDNIGEAEFFNVLGQKMKHQRIQMGKNLTDLSDLNNGVYIVRFKTQNGMHAGSMQLVKE